MSKEKDWGKREMKVQHVWYKILCKIMYLYELLRSMNEGMVSKT